MDGIGMTNMVRHTNIIGLNDMLEAVSVLYSCWALGGTGDGLLCILGGRTVSFFRNYKVCVVSYYIILFYVEKQVLPRDCVIW